MDSLGVDYVSLAEKIERLSGLMRQLSEEIGRIADISADLDIFWDGDANTAFIAGIGEDVTAIGIVMMRIRQTVNAVGKVFDIYMQNEKEVRRMIGDYRI